ncbi:MAG TPA: sigma-70 family RNA polymerase sigma factor [Polyangiaceae bacterium]|nr:sigma-70 family RNA polymerase sigma factor [Polyangiaceae bacterium]
MTDLAMTQLWLDLCTTMSVDQREQTRSSPREKLEVSATADDVGLIELVAGGDVRAYRQLVDRHLRGIHAFAYRMLGNRAEAEEVSQETFLRLWEHAGRYLPQAKPSTWIYRIAHNLSIDRLRRRRERSAPVAPDELPASERPSGLFLERQVAEAVQRALDELPERQRAAIGLVHYQGLSNAEAAEVLGVGVRALESLLARARRQLRDRLAALAPAQRKEEA